MALQTAPTAAMQRNTMSQHCPKIWSIQDRAGCESFLSDPTTLRFVSPDALNMRSMLNDSMVVKYVAIAAHQLVWLGPIYKTVQPIQVPVPRLFIKTKNIAILNTFLNEKKRD